MNVLRGVFTGFLMVLALTVSFVGTRTWQDSQTYLTPRTYVHQIVGQRGTGSAVVVSPGFALTAAHVVDGQEKLIINGLPVVAVWLEEKWELSGVDLALVHVPGLQCPCAPLGETPATDDKAVSIGYPLDAGQYATEGRIQEIALDSPRFYVSTPIIYGNSGGATFVWQYSSLGLPEWKLVGITVEGAVIPIGFGASFVTHIARIVPISTIYQFIEDIHQARIKAVNLEEKAYCRLPEGCNDIPGS